jgi:ATP-dependent helicase/nuclease subunit B
MSAHAPGLTLHVAPGPMLLRHAAQRIVEINISALPDLSGVVVLLPSLRAAAQLQRALARACGASALLLPRIETLQSWAAGIQIELDITPDSRRRAWLYESLRGQGWFAGADLWQLSGEILDLIDELTLHGAALPHSAEDFYAKLAAAYAGRRNAPLQFEAGLVHELWHALTQGGSEVDRVGAYTLRLARLAKSPSAPLYAIGITDLTLAEQAFFETYSRSQPVHCFSEAVSAMSSDAAASQALDPTAVCLQAAWTTQPDAAPLMSRARMFRLHFPLSPLQGRVRLFAANSLEQEAEAAALAVRQWLQEGRRAIALVAQDRLVARRARALLERSQVLLADESGWTLSTTSASTVLMRWLDLVAGDFYYRDLLDFLKSPFALADWDAAERGAAVQHIERWVLRNNFVSGLERLRRCADGAHAPAKRAIDLLVSAASLLARNRKPLAQWLAMLRQSLDALGVRAGLEADAAGRELLQRLTVLESDLRALRETHALGEWRRWLNHELESATFRDRSVDSPVVLTHLAALDLRAFEGVVILGADAAHLPAGRGAGLFNAAVRAQLGLPTRDQQLEREQARLASLIARCDRVLVTWQAQKDSEPNPLSPYFARLVAFHDVAYGDNLRERSLADSLPALRTPPSAASGTTAPAPGAPALVPAQLTAYGYASLLACPYQFYARHMLGLNEQDEVRETLEKKDYGDLVHRILHAFHRTHPRLTGLDTAFLGRELERISSAEFSGALAANYVAHAWRLRWQKLIPAYVQWQLQREADGWTWSAGEARRELPIALPDGGSLALKGRLDRVDVRHDAAPGYAVLDYKTKQLKKLREDADHPGEDAQLAVYALLLGEPIAEMAYVALDQEPVQCVALESDDNIIGANRQRIATLFAALRNGARLPAQGIAKVCEYCEMRGLCRKPYWNADEPAD